MRYFVGVDQGGSKTEILLGDENGLIVDKLSGFGYSAFIQDIKDSSEFAVRYLGQQVDYLKDLLQRNGIEMPDVYALTACMATVDSDDIKKYYEDNLRLRTSIENIKVYNDMYGAWRAGTNRLPSGVLGVGTGAGIWLFDENGKAFNLSGRINYQAALGLGYRAFLHACMSAQYLLEPTILSERICEFAQTPTIAEALKKTNNGWDVNALPYQHFVPFVYEAMLLKDRVAEDFVNQTGKGFADCIREGIRELGWENREVYFVMNGGSFKGKGFVLEKVIREYLSDLDNLILFQSEYEPVAGALLLSYDNYGISPDYHSFMRFKLRRNLH